MNYLNIHTDTLKSEAFIGAEPVERATWLCLLGWCVTQENGGTIPDCIDWTDRKWQQICGVTKDEVYAESGLFIFTGKNLRVAYYPMSQEDIVIKKREVSRANGKLGGRPKKKVTQIETNVGSENKPTLVSQNDDLLTQTEPTSESVKEGKGKEGKGKEPPNPQGGIWDGVFPKGSLSKNKTEQKRIKVAKTNEKMAFIGQWFSRKPETLWTVAEAKALQDLDPPKDEVIEMNEYRNVGYEFHRTNLAALLNNWSSDLDKARTIKAMKSVTIPDKRRSDAMERRSV